MNKTYESLIKGAVEKILNGQKTATVKLSKNTGIKLSLDREKADYIYIRASNGYSGSSKVIPVYGDDPNWALIVRDIEFIAGLFGDVSYKKITVQFPDKGLYCIMAPVGLNPLFIKDIFENETDTKEILRKCEEYAWVVNKMSIDVVL